MLNDNNFSRNNIKQKCDFVTYPFWFPKINKKIIQNEGLGKSSFCPLNTMETSRGFFKYI